MHLRFRLWVSTNTSRQYTWNISNSSTKQVKSERVLHKSPFGRVPSPKEKRCLHGCTWFVLDSRIHCFCKQVVITKIFSSVDVINTFLVGAWLINPYVLTSRKANVRLATWRILYGLSAGLSIMTACVSALLQPSTRFLLFIQKYNEAVENMKKVYSINRCKHRDTFDVSLKLW